MGIVRSHEPEQLRYEFKMMNIHWPPDDSVLKFISKIAEESLWSHAEVSGVFLDRLKQGESTDEIIASYNSDSLEWFLMPFLIRKLKAANVCFTEEKAKDLLRCTIHKAGVLGTSYEYAIETVVSLMQVLGNPQTSDFTIKDDVIEFIVPPIVGTQIKHERTIEHSDKIPTHDMELLPKIPTWKRKQFFGRYK